jgi:hypothetical protein
LLFRDLFEAGVVQPKEALEAHWQAVRAKIEVRWVDWVIAVGLAVGLTVWYRHSTLQSWSDWIHPTPGTLSVAGIYWIYVHAISGYVAFRFLYAMGVVIWGIRGIFRDGRFGVSLKRLHPDGCLGLKPISLFAFRLSLVLCVVGLALAVMVSVGVYRRGGGLEVLIVEWGYCLAILSYVVIAPALFFLPLMPAHRHMEREKKQLLLSISRAFEDVFRRCESARFEGKELPADTEKLRALEHLYDRAQRMPVWPFSFGILTKFAVTVVVPVALPILSHLILMWAF